jgi:hypothetical protein
LGGALAAAGPIAAVAFAATEVTKSFQNMKGQVDALTVAAGSLAKNDFAGFQDGLDQFGQNLVGQVPILGDLANAEVGLIKSIVSIPSKLDAAFLERAKVLGGYSGAIAGAEANADVRSLLADMREADTLGPDLARMVDAQSRLDTSMRELLLPLKQFALEWLAPRLEAMATGAEVVANLPSILREIADSAVKALAIVFSTKSNDEALAIINGLPDRLASIINADKPQGDMFARALESMNAAQVPQNAFRG